ncbi:sialidase family protein [Microbacterium capsulatum]|uniref:Sialidase family protein n=1 Tax=Microbacterium capsulatum TaxID=3041921 RepID=A0ABU0XEI8_9MICO|nr:sialidase family protein [Microbacterium sp. ASV81]MDQ4213508.1 sialidase family protein [Microbacterium sp. ASV81]
MTGSASFPRVSPTVRRRFVAVDDTRWVQCHASTLIRSGDSVEVAFFAGTAEGTPDNRILMASSTDLATWTDPLRMDEGDAVAHWNPVLAHDPTGRLGLFYKHGALISAWSTRFRRRRDDRTWEPARELVPGDSGGRGPVRNAPIVAAGRWFAPASTEDWEADGGAVWESFVDVSADDGATWTALRIPLDRTALRGAGIIQPALWFDRRGGISALCRSTEGSVYLSRSIGTADDVRGFEPARPAGLPNNNSGLAVLALPDGRLVCAHNPVSGDWAARCPLGLSVSDDDGPTWRYALTVEDGVTRIGDGPEPSDGSGHAPTTASATGVVTTGVGEYSYPAIILDGERLLISYTWQRRGIVVADIPVAALG